MRIRLLLITALLIFSLVPMSAAENIGDDNISLPEMINQYQPDQTGWYEEYIWTEVNPEGDFYGNAELRGSDILFDGIDFEDVWPAALLDTLRWGSVSTNPASHPDEHNLWIDLTFETNDAPLAESYAEIIKDSFSTAASINLVEFQGSYGFDDNYGDGWKSYTNVQYRGHVEWSNYLEIIDRSVPRDFGGIAETIDVFPAKHLSFHFWTEGSNALAATIGLHYNVQIENRVGGFSISLKSLIPVDWFAPSPQSNQYWIHHRLPEVSNLAYSLGNTSDTSVYIRYEPPPEEHNKHAIYQIDTNLRQGANYSDIVISFDYEFIPYDWANRERMNWEVDRRGYSNINLEVMGVDRAYPTAALYPESSIFGDILSLGFDVDPNFLVIPGHHTQWLDLSFPVGYDYQMANATLNTIITELETLGLSFPDRWNNTDWDDPNNYQDTWIPDNQTHVPTDSLSAAGILNNRAEFDTMIQNSYVYPRSAMWGNTTMSTIDAVHWGLETGRWGFDTHMTAFVTDLHRSDASPAPYFTQLVEQDHFVNLLDPIYLGWSNQIPWNNYSEELSVRFDSPYTGDYSSIDFQPDDNNGINWDSGRWTDFRDGTQRFNYEVRFYSMTPQMIEYVNDQEIASGPFQGANVTYSNYYFDLTFDLESPFVWALRYENTTMGMDEFLPGYPSYYRVEDGMAVSGDLSLAATVYDYSPLDFWDGSSWQPRYPTSGIDTMGTYMYRTDAPIDHPIFTKTLNLMRNASWVYDAADSQVWEGTVDTTLYPDGEWNLWSDVADNSGNMGTNFIGNIYIDNYDDSYTPSQVIWTDAPEDNAPVRDIVWYNFTVHDDVGAFAVIAWNNLGGYFQAPINEMTNASGYYADFAFKVDTLAQGIPENSPMTITIEVLDFDGHWSYATVHSIIDNIPTGNPPVVSLQSPSSGHSVNNTIQTNVLFQANVTDDWGLETVLIRIEHSDGTVTEFNMFYNSGTDMYEYNADISNWQLGDYTWAVEVTDVDENTHTILSDTWNLTIEGIAPIVTDTTAPQIILIEPSDGQTVTGTIDIEAEVTDDVAISQVSLKLPDDTVVEMTLSGSNYKTTWDSASVQDGEFDLTITAKDTSGNTETLTFSVVTNNGRTQATPDIGLPGYTWFVAILGLTVPIIMRKKNIKI